MAIKDKYVLRERDDDEIARLAFQHEVWKKESDFAIEKAGVKPGDRIIDLGSGPGYLSIDLLKHIERIEYRQSVI